MRLCHKTNRAISNAWLNFANFIPINLKLQRVKNNPAIMVEKTMFLPQTSLLRGLHRRLHQTASLVLRVHYSNRKDKFLVVLQLVYKESHQEQKPESSLGSRRTGSLTRSKHGCACVYMFWSNGSLLVQYWEILQFMPLGERVADVQRPNTMCYATPRVGLDSEPAISAASPTRQQGRL